jgi:hypothetical protein
MRTVTRLVSHALPKRNLPRIRVRESMVVSVRFLYRFVSPKGEDGEGEQCAGASAMDGTSSADV